MKKFSSWFMGNQPGRQQKQAQSGRPKKNVHWKSAERPSPPGRPILIPLSDQQPDVVTLKWERPKIDGGSPIIGYIIEHRRMGSPHWVRSSPAPVTGCEVSISGLEPGWRYQFRAIAENVVGKSDPSELSDPLTVTLQRNAISVPRFVSELTDMSVVESERIEFRVTVLGQPPPEISWFKDGYEIFSSRRTKIVNDNDVSVLIIHQVALTDEGEIKCTATNRAGHVVTKAKLMVEAPPKIRLPRNYEDGLIVEADEVLRLKVGIAGQPPPSVVWLHEGEPIFNTGRHELVTSDKNSSLKIDNVKRVDRGEYSIKAANKLGEDSTSFLVTVTSKPNPPGKVRLNTSYGKSATLSWTTPEDDGGCKIGNYILEYFRIGWNVWLKAATTRQLSTTLNDLIEGSEYKFRVKAENPYGLSDPGEESDILFVPDPKRGITKPDGNGVDKPVPPRRKTLSPQRALPDGEERGGSISPRQPSPLLDRKTKPQILDNEDLHREMSYGTNLSETRKSPPSSSLIEVRPVVAARRSPSPRKRIVEEKKKAASVSVSTSTPKSDVVLPTPPTLPPKPPQPTSPPVILPIKPPFPPKNPPAIAPALGPVLTSAIAPVLRFTPSAIALPAPLPTPPPARTLTPKLVSSREAKSNKSLSKQSTVQQKEKSSKKPVERPPLSRNRSLSPIEVEQLVRGTPPKTPPELQKASPVMRNRSLSPIEVEQPVRDTPPRTPPELKKTSPITRNRSFSPFEVEQPVRGTPPKTPPELKKTSPVMRKRSFSSVDVEQPVRGTPPELRKTSQALQRSEEPVDLDVNQRVQRYSNRGYPLEKDREPSQNGGASNPRIHISAPTTEPASLSEVEKRDEVHTSSEFMLVLFHKNSKVKDKEKQDSFDLDLEEALQPPPISISAPDLAILEFTNLQAFPLRRSVSSTELLYERAMARFYEAVEMEEAGKAKKIKVSQEKLSVQPTTIRKRLGSLTEAERLSFEKRSEMRRRSADIGELATPSNFKWDSKDNISNMRPLSRTREMLNQQYRQESQETDDGSDYHQKTGESCDVESDYTASTESVSEDSIEKFKRELVARTRSTTDELETYHPRSMSAGTFTPYRAPTPEQSAIVLNRPMPLPSPDFIPKPILKRPSNESVVNDEPSSPNIVPSSPILPSSPAANEKIDKTKVFKSFFKWDKKSPTEKNTEANAEPPLPNPTKSSVDLEIKRKAKEEEERQKLEANRIFQEEAKVVVDHYSDIVRQVGSTKKYNLPLYLNRDELKKAAEKAAQEGNVDDDIEDFDPSSAYFERLHKPRLSLAERQQIQHVIETPSRLAMSEKTIIPESPSEEEATPSSASLPSPRSESRGRTKIVKVKKIVKKRVPSGTRSRDTSTSRPPSSIGASSEDFGRRQLSRTRVAADKTPVKKDLPLPLPLQTQIVSPPQLPSVALVAVPQKSADELTQEAEEKVRSAFSYVTDVCLFIAACYVYLFKDARLVLPILALMVYRQLGEVIRNNIPDWMKKKRQ